MNHNFISRGLRRLSVLIAFLVCASPGMAQLDSGTISGNVTDQSGGAAPGATITIRNVETGVARTLQTNAAGRYDALALPVGSYEVQATLPGFQTAVRSGITLSVGRNAVVNIVLQVGEVTQAITVAGEASFVETTTATVTNLVDERRVLDIPLNNRDLTQLAVLQPGVLQIPQRDFNFSPERAHRAGNMGQKLFVGGARGNQNVFLVDGVTNSDLTGGVATASGAYSGAETIQEFQVITNNYSAEYPSKPGAIISAVTKSGTNAFHGSLYEFLRNDNLDAARWEDNAFDNEKPEFKRNHLGGSLGGPVLRDRTFFFVSYEALREREGLTETNIIPSAEGRQGILGPGDVVEINPIMVPYLNLYPVPGGANQYLEGQENTLIEDLGSGRARVASTRRKSIVEDFGNVKMDHQFANEKAGFLAVTYNIADARRNTVGLLPFNTSTAFESRNQTLSVRHTSILSPTTLNEIGIGYSSTGTNGDLPSVPVEWSNFNGVDLRWDKSKPDMGEIQPGDDITSIGYENSGDDYRMKLLSIKEGLSITRPTHTMRMGFEVNRFSHPLRVRARAENGNFDFDNFRSFLRGEPYEFLTPLPDGVPLIGGLVNREIKRYDIGYSVFGMYFQDNWKVLPTLTLNLGMRYEFMSTPADNLGGNISSFRDRSNLASIQVGEFLFRNPTKRSFSPRFGFAWAPGDQRTSIRGGFGIYFDHPVLYNYSSSIGRTPPFNTGGSIDADVAQSDFGETLDFPGLLSTQLHLLQSSPSWGTVDYNVDPTYIYRWSLTVERQLEPWFLSVGYTGSRAYHTWLGGDTNQNRWVDWPATVPTDQKRWSESSRQRIFPHLGRTDTSYTAGRTWHNSMTVNVLRRLTSGLQAQVAYTFSKTVDRGSAFSNTEGFIQGGSVDFYYDGNHRQGRASFDIRNNFVTNVTYDFPESSLGGVGGALVNGWQVNGILTLSDGIPFRVESDAVRSYRSALQERSGHPPNLITGGNNDPTGGPPNRYYDPNQFIPATCVGGVYCYEPDSRGRMVGQPELGYGYYDEEGNRYFGFGNLGWNTLSGPGTAVFNFSLNKRFQLTEENSLQFRAEFFNLLNRPNFSLPEEDLFFSRGDRNPLAGQISSTNGSSRQIQFGLRFAF